MLNGSLDQGLLICLGSAYFFSIPEPEYAYKRYAYKKHAFISKIFFAFFYFHVVEVNVYFIAGNAGNTEE